MQHTKMARTDNRHFQSNWTGFTQSRESVQQETVIFTRYGLDTKSTFEVELKTKFTTFPG